ncbi:MAG TPA: AI-2E family transporter [Roseiflexaceae bacterium]|nr:AI-2E family transporter [Roseiflexaceae bacterium]
MQRLAQITAVVLVTVIGALVLWQMHEAVQLLLVALTVAAGIEPLVRRLMGRGLGRGAAVALAYLAALGLIGALGLFFGSLAAADLDLLARRLPGWYDQGRLALINSGWATDVAVELPSAERLTSSLAREQRDDMLALITGVAASALMLATLAISAATLGFYWLLDRQRIERLWLSLLPLDVRTTARAVWAQVYNEVGIYVRGEAVIVALATLALLSVYAALDVPAAALLAVVGGVAQVVPLLGLPLAVAPGVLAALTHGPQTAGLALAGALYVLSVVRLVIGRRVFRAGVNVNPVLVMFMIIALADLGGVWMVLLAPPLAAAVQASVRTLNAERSARVSGGPRAAALRERLDAVEAAIAARAGNDPRLADLLARARRLVNEASARL